jgi:thiol-disulfide isomerase/thioredoxin
MYNNRLSTKNIVISLSVVLLVIILLVVFSKSKFSDLSGNYATTGIETDSDYGNVFAQPPQANIGISSTPPTLRNNDSPDETITYDSITPDQVVIIYAPWCGYCKRSMDDFNQAVNESFGKIVKVSSENPQAPKIMKDLKGNGYPHIAKGLGTGKPQIFEGKRTKTELLKFAKVKK